MKLVEIIASGHDTNRGAVLMQHLPTRTGFSITGGAGKAPDPAAIVQLVEMIARGNDPDGGAIVVQHLPAGAGFTVQAAPVKRQIRPLL